MRREKGFTLLELMVVMAIIATLMTIAMPRYFNSLEASKETTLRQSLAAMREALDHYYGDTGRYPIPSSKWWSSATCATSQWTRSPNARTPGSWWRRRMAWQGGVADIKSGATGRARDGSLYSEW
jgi:general secretion pathway protein G